MTHRNRIDAEALLCRAKASNYGEAFDVIARGDGYAIGVGARAPVSRQSVNFIEIIVTLSLPTPAVDLSSMGRRLAVLEQLEARGYSLISQDNSDIVCEVEVRGGRIQVELEAVESLLVRTVSDRRQSSPVQFANTRLTSEPTKTQKAIPGRKRSPAVVTRRK